MSIEEIKKYNPMGIIFTGGPNSVYDENSPHVDPEIFNLGIPVLGICYGAQLMAWTLGGTVRTCETSEYGKTKMTVDAGSFLFDGLTDLYTVTAVATAQRRYELANVPAAPVLDASPGSGAIPAGGAESETSHPGTEEEAAHE